MRLILTFLTQRRRYTMRLILPISPKDGGILCAEFSLFLPKTEVYPGCSRVVYTLGGVYPGCGRVSYT